jgi:putative endonuclease
MGKHNETGRLGEQLAVQYLRDKGYTILETNWRSGKAEVDIIAKIKEILVFVEVKTRSSVQFGFPEEYVCAKKEKLLFRAAGNYMELVHHEWEIRFDIVSVVLVDLTSPEIVHFVDTFFPME